MHNVDDAMLKMLSIYRHEFLNYLQVVAGLAQLNKTERLMAYIRKVSEEVQQFGRLAGCGDPRLALIIYEAFFQGTTENLVLQVRGDFPLINDEVLATLSSMLMQFNTQLSNGIQSTLAVSLDAGERPCLRIQIIEGPDLFTSIVLSTEERGIISYEINEAKKEITIALG
ncbi:MAG: Spo0B domain-containing protein [Clostridiales bacterium]|nr:Spo0B domain-containing protein [Clostridiales bacterium]